MRGRARLFLHRFEQELFRPCSGYRAMGKPEGGGQGACCGARQVLHSLLRCSSNRSSCWAKNSPMLDVAIAPMPVASGLLWYFHAEAGRAPAEIRRAAVQSAGIQVEALTPSEKAMRK